MQAESSLEFTHFHACVVCAVPCASPLAAVWSAFALPQQRAHRFAPTVLPLAQSVPARPSAPLDNRKIAFGCVRLAPPPLCAKAARLAGAMRRAVGTGALAALGRLATPPPRIPLSPRCAIHPRMRLAWLGRDTSLRPATPPRGVLRIPAQNPLWPRGQRRPSRPRYSQNVGASVAACTSPSAPCLSLALSWRACAYLARSEAWRRRHEAEQAQTAGRARRRDCACAARREVFRPSAPLRRRGWIARLTADARAVTGGAPPQRLPKLSADRMCWAGNAAAVSRARCARSAGLRRTRIPMAIFRLSSGARTQQDGAYRMAGEVAAAFSAYGLANTHHAVHTTPHTPPHTRKLTKHLAPAKYTS